MCVCVCSIELKVCVCQYMCCLAYSHENECCIIITEREGNTQLLPIGTAI